MKRLLLDAETVAKIDNYCLMDDVFMKLMLKENYDVAKLFIEVILDIKNIVIEDVNLQEYLQGGNSKIHTLDLDVLARDSEGRLFNIEFQNAASGATPQRARYHSSMLDANMFTKGSDYTDLVDTYIIFITAKDVLGFQEPIYDIQRKINNTNKLFGDGSHIVYVNSLIRNINTALGRLMHDLYCRKASDMFYEELKQGMRYYKDTQEGRVKMYTTSEWLMAKGKTEGKLETKLESVKNLMDSLKVSAKEAMILLKYPESEQKELMAKL